MPTVKDAEKLVDELERTGETIMLTTPNCNFGIKQRDPTHHLFLRRKHFNKY